MMSLYEAYTFIAVTLLAMAILGLMADFKFRRPWILVFFILLLALCLRAGTLMLGEPQPVWLLRHFTSVKTAEVLYVELVENKAIYLLLTWPGLDHPLYVEYQWSKKLAEQLQDAKDEAAQDENSGGVGLDLPFDPSLDNRTDNPAYPLPQPKAMPAKPEPQDEVIEVPEGSL